MNIQDIMTKALSYTRREWIDFATTLKPGELHAQLSRDWIKNLAQMLRVEYPPEENDYYSGYRVLARDHHKRNKAEFGMNEYLYDITLIKVGTLKSATGQAELKYPLETVCHIESEFCTNDSRASIVDYGKLLMSGAQKKYMVLPAGGRIQE